MTMLNSVLTPPLYDSSSMEVSSFSFSWWADKDCQTTNNRNDNAFVAGPAVAGPLLPYDRACLVSRRCYGD